MTRKILREERELRKYLDQRLMEDEYQNASTQLTALIRAVREDCARVAATFDDGTPCNHTHRIAAAIRGTKR